MSRRSEVEVFRFRHAPRNQYYVPRSPQVLFPKSDGVTKMLKAYFAVNPEFIFMTEFGVGGRADVDLIQ